MMPGVSAGSNQVGARVTWMPQVSWPCGPPARTVLQASIARSSARNIGSRRFAGLPRAGRRHNNGRNVKPVRVAFPVICASSARVRRAAICFVLLFVRQTHVLVGCRIRKVGDEPEARFLNPRAHAVKESKLPQRREHGALVHELLDFSERRVPPRLIEFTRLLVE